MENKICAVCSKEMKLIPAGVSKKTQKPYNEFWACPDKCQQPRKSSPENQMIMDALVGLNNRFDNMAKYLKSKLDKPEDVNNIKF